MGNPKKHMFWHKWQWTRFHQLLHDNHGVRYFVSAVFIIIASGMSVLAWAWQQPESQLPTLYPTQKKKVVEKIYSPLTGIEVADKAITARKVTAIMIENSPDARPQSGLLGAGIVYEAVAEAGITRFVALYQESRPSLVGPVRSVRPYYVEWAAAYDPAMAHIGGSSRALQMIRSGSYGVDIDQFFNAGAYWRASDRAAPHNVYTDFDKLDALTASKGKTSSTFTGFLRKDDKKKITATVSNISMPISSANYAVNYSYDATSNSYTRSVGGEPHVDREKGQIKPKVAIALQVQSVRGFEDGYREQITTVGEGKAWIFQDGEVVVGTWKRSDDKAPLMLLGVDGKPLSLNRGQTWISALPNDREATWQ